MLLNKQQKEFRRQMKKAEKKRKKEGIEDPYSYRNENYRPTKERKNTFFFWIVAFVTIIFGINVLSTIGGNHETRAPIKVESWDTSEEEVHIYLSKTKETSSQLLNVWNKFTSMEQVDAMTIQDLEGLKKEVTNLQDDIKSDKDEFQELELYFMEQIQLTNQMINTYQENKEKASFVDAFQINQIRNKFNENLLEEQLMVIRVLEQQGLSFELNQDGSISYEYKNSILEDK